MSESIDNIKTKICDACNLYKNYYYTLKTASYIPGPVGLAAQSVIKSGGELCRYCSIYDDNKLIVTKHAQQLLESYSKAMNIYKSVMGKYNQKTLVVKEPVALKPVEESIEPIALEPIALEPIALEPIALEPIALEPVEGGYKRRKSRRQRSKTRRKSRLSKRKTIKKKSKKNRRR
jgi:hypothetical protein